MNIKIRLIILNFLEFSVWGAYLTSMGRYLGTVSLETSIGWFYSMQGMVSLFMPALMGIVADRWIPTQRLLGICHGFAGAFMCGAGFYAMTVPVVEFAPLFGLYSVSVAFFMPTIALGNSVAFNVLLRNGMDTVTNFPPIRVFGTVGFIVTMWVVDLVGAYNTPVQFLISGCLSITLMLYSFTLPQCPCVSHSSGSHRSIVDALGLRAFSLFKQKNVALFFIFSMLLGMCLQITNGYANPFLGSFEAFPEFADSFGVKHSGILISISQISEALCILAIPFFLKRFGIKGVMLIAILAWVVRFGFFGLGNPSMPGVFLFVLSCIVYGFAFDFFNISGALFVDRVTTEDQRSSAQGLLLVMINGFGATIGTLAAQAIVNNYVYSAAVVEAGPMAVWDGWKISWFIFAGFALVIGIAFWIFFPKIPITQPNTKD